MLPEGIRKPITYFRSNHYSTLSFLDLITEITNGNRQALDEFHNNRTLSRYVNKPPLRCIEYLNLLRTRAEKRHWPGLNSVEVAEEGYNLTLDKFSHLPIKALCPSGRNMKRIGPDCRLYFRAGLNRIISSFEKEPPDGQIEEERRVAMIFQGLVDRHFNFSLLEAARRVTKFWTRYFWNTKGGSVCVWLPVSLKGRERKLWLENNINDSDLSQPNAKRRIQEIINRNFAKERFVPFFEAASIEDHNDSIFWKQYEQTTPISLAKLVAEEKAENIDKQRRSIQALGQEKLKDLILRVFEDIDCDCYSQRKVGRDFDLAPATLTRFSGSAWHIKGSAIPDLWINTAHVVSNHDAFREVAQETGVWQQVQETLKKDTFNRNEG